MFNIGSIFLLIFSFFKFIFTPTNVTFLYSQNSSESKRFALSDDNRDDISGNTVVCQSIPGLNFFYKCSTGTYKVRKVFYIYM